MNSLKGYLKISITGVSPERFMNLCKNKNIQLWQIKSNETTYEFYVRVIDFRKLKPIAKKTRSKVRIIKKYGIPFFFYKYRRRKMFFAGSLFVCFFMFVMTFFVWNIELHGNFSITEDQFFDYLRETGIHPGKAKNSIDCDVLEKNIRNKFENVVWVSVSQQGTSLYVDIKENEDTVAVNEVEKPCDLIADQTGTIMEIITNKGVPLVAVGDTVKEGDLLVSGTIEIKNDLGEIVREEYVAADAKIVIERTVSYQSSLNLKYKKKEYTGKEQNSFYMQCGKCYMRLGPFVNLTEPNYEIHSTKAPVEIKEQFCLPIWYGVENRKEYVYQDAYHGEEEARQILTKKYQNKCKELCARGNIMDEHTTFFLDSKKAYLNGQIKIKEEIGKKRKIIDLSSETMIEYNGL